MNNPISPEHSALPNPSTTTSAAAPHGGGATTSPNERDFQRAYLLRQVQEAPDNQLAKGKANRFPRAVARELNLAPMTANKLRDEMVEEGLLRTLKKSGSIVYELTDKGRTALPHMQQKPVPEGRKPVREAPVSDEVRQQRKTFLLFQLFEAPQHTLEQKEANRFREPGRKFLSLSASTANRLRKEMADQKLIAMTKNGRNATYRLTPEGIEFLGVRSSFPEAEFTLNGRVLNELLEAARETARQFQTAPEPAQTREPEPVESVN